MKTVRLNRYTALRTRQERPLRCSRLRVIGRDRFASTTLKRAVFERDRGFCRYCRQTIAYDVGVTDHVMPKGRGGQTTLENLVWCCPADNRSKGNQTVEEFMASVA